MTREAPAVTTFIDALTDEDFDDLLAAALDLKRVEGGARQVLLAIKRPRDKVPLRAMVFEAFGPKPAPRMPDYDAIPDLDLT